MTLQHIPSSGMLWAGYDYSATAILYGSGFTAGTHIVYLDSVHSVFIQVASADTIQIHNGLGATRAGNVTLVW